ncbi:MAG: hypothetical protein HY961_16120 [Ignavibacteriae bacterium]|nr:hypothetical protein [Ignavibacteriota bacterium]
MKSHSKISPLTRPIPAARQSTRRHYGVHPYFTRRPPNVVRKYILHYSNEGERVLDPFGGSGVAAIEAFLENRIGIQNDINPFANFIAQGIVDLAKGDLSRYKNVLSSLKDRCERRLLAIADADESRVQEILATMDLPPNVELPSDSDARTYHDLFTPRQLCSLALLKTEIDCIEDEYAKSAMRLAWSATLAKLNRTFLSAEGRAESRGGSSIFSIYRYKIARKPVELPAWKTFSERALNILAAKEEIERAIDLKRRTSGWSGTFQARSCDVDELVDEFKNSVDYIFTDPPYGGHISYLDLSSLWTIWLGSAPSRDTREREMIVGGDLCIPESTYIHRLGNSMRVCTQLLKQGRWLSVVFQHWNINYFESILSSITQEGAELKAAVSQVGDPVWSMHKKKNKELVLAGELILTFYKSGRVPKMKGQNGFNAQDRIRRVLAETRADRIYSEGLFNDLIIAAWRNSAIHSLNISRDEFTSLIEGSGWSYDSHHHCWVRQKTARPSLFAVP